MITIYDQAQIRSVSADYAAYRDRVVAAGGSIGSASATQDALTYFEANPSAGIVQWLDARHGLSTSTWFGICGASSDAAVSIYGNPVRGQDATLGQAYTLAGGAWDGGRTPALGLTGDDYTWYMRAYLSTGADGWLWGDRFDKQGGTTTGWNYLATDLWRSYNNGTDTASAVTLPRDQWADVFVVKEGATVTGYLWVNGQESVLFSVTLNAPIEALSIGIAGGTDSNGVCPPGVHYQTFLRASTAFTAAQRAAIQSI